MSANIAMGSDKTLTTSNITHDSELTITSNLLMGSDKTLTTSNIVANSGENLSLNSSLFVDTATGNVGVGQVSPGAKLDVNGDIKINGEIKHNIPSVYSVYSVMSTSSSSPNTLFTGKSITMDRLFLAAIDAVVVMDGSALGNALHFAKPLRYWVIGANTLEAWYSIYDGATYEKAVIVNFTINSSNNSLAVYHSGSRYKTGIQYNNSNDPVWTDMTVAGYRVRYFRIVI